MNPISTTRIRPRQPARTLGVYQLMRLAVVLCCRQRLASAWSSTVSGRTVVRPLATQTRTPTKKFSQYSSTQSICRHRTSLSASISTTSDVADSTNDHNLDPDDNPLLADNNDPSQDTIFALSSGFSGEQATAVAVIRISGPQAHNVLQQLLSSKLPKPRQAALKKLYYNGAILDHALVLLFSGPNSFTGQDIVELQCHGSRAIVQRLLNEVLPDLGCRLAEPGEFTQRAFGNGKLDLVQVEALADVLTADTSKQVEQALQQLDGRVSKIYQEWRQQLVSGLAHAEAVIDFGDDEHLGDDDDMYFDDDDDGMETEDDALQRQQKNVWGEVGFKMQKLRQSMESQLEDGRRGEIIREGVKIAIVGPPNAGKSSLFNLLARQDAAIVSPIAGTTRDVLKVSMDLGGVKCTLQDTAGVRSETNDILELEGMKRAQAVVEEADLVVAMVDAMEESHGLGIVESVLDDCENHSNDGVLDPQRLLLVKNKIDLTVKATDQKNGKIKSKLDFGGGTFEISCVTQDGIGSFLTALTQQVMDRTQQGNGNNSEGALITRVRHRQHVEAAVEALERFDYLSTEGNMAVDMAAEELRLAASELGRVTGAVDVEDILDVLFTDFCIGK